MDLDLSKLTDKDLAAIRSGNMQEVSDEGLNIIRSQGQAAQPTPSIMDKLPLVNSKIGKALSGGLDSAVQATPAAAVGAVEGASLDTAKPIAAFAGSTADLAKQALQGQVPDVLNAPNKYQQYKKFLADKENQLADESPLGYTIGNLTGMAATMPLLGEGQAAMLGKAGKLAPGLDRFLAGEAGGLASRVAGKAAGSAIEGAPVGALAGATNSKATNPEDFVSDVATGTGAGSILGAAIGGGLKIGGESLAAAPKLADKWDFTRKTKVAYGMGKEGMNFDTSAGKGEVAKQMQSIPTEITNTILAADKANGIAVGAALDNAEAAGIKINVDPELQAASSELFQTFNDNPVLLQTVDPKSRQLLLKLGRGGLGDMSPVEARALKDSLYDLSGKLDGMTSDVASIARKKSSDVGSAINQSLKDQIPEYKDAATKFENFRSSVAEPMLQPDLPADKRTKMLGDLKNKSTELYKGTRNVLGGSMLPGAQAVEGPRAALNEVTGNLFKIEKNNPNAMTTLGGSAEDVGNRWKNLSDRMAVLKQSQGFEPHEGIGKTALGSLVGAGEGFAYGMANRAGRIAETVGQSTPVKMASKIFNADDGALIKLAQKMKSSNFKGAAIYGDALERAVQNKSTPARNALLFKMLQDPDYREMLKSAGYSDEENK